MSDLHMFQKAEQAFKIYKKASAAQKATLLRTIAEEIENLGNELLEIAHQESNLPIARLTGERGRTTGQLKAFADLLDDGSWVEATIDTALPDRQPIPRPDLRRMLVPLGPVAVFGASNFPLAFSTAGGDTASALAAGCPVIYKEHPAHPKTSKLVAEAILKALKICDLPKEVFQHVSGGLETGQALVKNPSVKAVAFTGSYQGGKAIFDAACARKQPIPVFAEMGSVNPIFILPEKSKKAVGQLAEKVAQSVLLGVGQFCTSPGLVFFPSSEFSKDFVDALSHNLKSSASAKMLHEGICKNYYNGTSKLFANKGVEKVLYAEEDNLLGNPALAKTSLSTWLENPELQEEIFGPVTLVVEYQNVEALESVAEQLHGQLTCTVWAGPNELISSESFIDILREKCGRLLFDGVPTGVEVSAAMTHGGPFPATTDSRSTSVGTNAIKRFARPVTFQSAPQELLPEELKDENTLSIWRTVNNKLTQESLLKTV